VHELEWDELVACLETAAFTGLLFEGALVEVDGLKLFRTLPWPVYLEARDLLLKLSTGGNCGEVLFSPVDAPTLDPDDHNETDLLGVVDVGFTYFGEWESVQCVELRCAIDTQPGPGHGSLCLVEMTFSGDQRVLFDPWWPAGIRTQTAMTLESAPIFKDYLAGKVSVRTWSRTA
jgi:hypothetical protein